MDNITKDLTTKLLQVYREWQKNYNISDDNVIYDDGEYEPNLITVLNSIVVYINNNN